MRVVMETPCFVVTFEPETSLVRYTRKAKAFESSEQTIQQHVELGTHLDLLGRRDHALLVDVRQSPFNPSLSFENAIAESRKHLFRGFSRVAILVRSAVGALQLHRHVREDGLEIPVYREEQEALRFLAHSADKAPSSRRFPR